MRARALSVSEAAQLLAAAEPPRRSGTTQSAWLSDKTERSEALLLCWSCEQKFVRSRMSRRYYLDRKLGKTVAGKCDGCPTYCTGSPPGQLFIPERLLAQPGRSAGHNETWTPR